MRIIEQLAYKITSDTSQFDKGIAGADKKVDGLDKSMGKSAKSANALSGGLKAIGIGLSITGAVVALNRAFQASAEAFGGFQSSIAKTSTLFGDINVNMDNLNQRVLELSSDTGELSSEIGESLYQALSAGIPVTEDMGEAIDFMDKSARLAKAGFTDLDGAVDVTTSILNAYHLAVSETDKIHKILIQTQNKGKTTVNELGQNLAKVTPTASAFGVSFDNIGASLATMTAQGTPTMQATTQLNQIIAELGKQGTIASTALMSATESAGLQERTFKDLIESGYNLGQILDLMNTYAKENELSMVDMFSSIDAGKGSLSLAGDNLASFNKNLEAMSTNVDVVGDAYSKVMNSWDEQNKKLKTSVQNLGIAMQSNLLPAITPLVGKVTDLVNKMSGNYEVVSDLEIATGDLGTATNNYNTTVKQLLDPTNKLTEAERARLGVLRDIQAASVEESVYKVAKAYTSTERQINENKETLKELIIEENAYALVQNNIEEARNRLKILNKEKNKTDEEEIEYMKLYQALADTTFQRQTKLLTIGEEIAEKTAENAELTGSFNSSLEALAKSVANGTADIGIFALTHKEFYDAVYATVEILEEQAKAQEDVVKWKDYTVDQLKEEIAYLKQGGGYGESATYVAEKLALAQELLAEKTGDAVDVLDKEAEAYKRLTDEELNHVIALISADNARERALANSVELSNSYKKEAQGLEAVSEWLKEYQEEIGYSIQGINMLSSIWDNLNEAQANANEAELQRMEEAGASEEELNEKKRQFAIEDSKRSKAQASFQAVIDTASAVIGFLANPGWPWGFALSAAAVGVGASQIAAINSAPIPSYAVGTIDVPSDRVAQLHAGETVLTKGITEEAKTRGITIAPTGQAGGKNMEFNVYLDGKMIARKVVENVNSGQVGKIDMRVVK